MWHRPDFSWLVRHAVFLYLTISIQSVWLSGLQDFREAVSRASRQSGKPVIEERLLNQILYYLPQLYELNQDLLRELQLRVAKWYLHNQVLTFLWAILDA